MPQMPPAEPNADQIAYWNADTGRRWAALQDHIDAMFAPLTATALALAAPQPGERVLDVGCGCGTTLVELASRVGPGGSAVGVDISEPMLALAATRIAALAQARIIRTDAASHRFEPTSDLAFSRFGVMFFDDPVAAFRNIHTALAPGGRLVMAVWRALADNEWAHVPMALALPHLPPQPPSDPEAPGPFAFANPERVRGILTEAGFSEVALRPHETRIHLGDAAEAASRATQIGPTARALRDAPPDLVETVVAAIRAGYEHRAKSEGITLGGGIWLVTAQA